MALAADNPLATAVLTVDLDAVQANYRLLKGELGGLPTAAAVKGDAYGVGAVQASRAMANIGCEDFFVVSVEEGIEIKPVVGDGRIHVLYGAMPGSESALVEHGLTPVMNSLGDIERWAAEANRLGRPLPCDLHFDTGMSRTGFPAAEADVLEAEPARLQGLEVDVVMSHLHSADAAGDAYSAGQLERFQDMRSRFAQGRASFANSSGCFLGPGYRFDLGRPGIALYGGNPLATAANPMQGVIRLESRVLQVREIAAGDVVGYSATFTASETMRVATVPLGYADGYHRSLGNAGLTHIDGIPCPVLGRISMDLISIDVTAVPETQARAGALVEVIGPHQDIEDVAVRAGTNSNEILTSLGARYHRVYVGGQ